MIAEKTQDRVLLLSIDDAQEGDLLITPGQLYEKSGGLVIPRDWSILTSEEWLTAVRLVWAEESNG